jgi:hypothetical protein
MGHEKGINLREGVDKVTKVAIRFNIYDHISSRSKWKTGFAQQKFRPDLYSDRP